MKYVQLRSELGVSREQENERETHCMKEEIMKKIVVLLVITMMFLSTCEPYKSSGSISITSNPTGAEVYLDGNNTGKTTNCVLDSIEAGKHTVILKKENYKNYEEEVTVEANKTVTINATLISLPDLEWCYVSAGWFTMGSADSTAEEHESPEHNVYLDSFYISKYEVTNAQYCEFLNAYGNSCGDNVCIDLNSSYCDIYYQDGKYYVKEGKDNYPVVEVTWFGAKAFCEYYGWRLPTEAEWEKAARGTDKRKYPWGDHEPYYDGKYYANYNPGSYDEDGYEYSSPAGSFPEGASPYGCMDMAGNVWEWVNDWYDSYYYSTSPDHNPQGPSTGFDKIIRGGSWLRYPVHIRCSEREPQSPQNSVSDIGFRPVKNE